jgi:hypothetical protein
MEQRRGPDYVTDFLRRRGLRRTESVEQEANAIHWTSAAHIMVDQGYALLNDDVLRDEPAIGWLRNLLARNFEHVESTLVAFLTKSGEAVEGLSRLAMESSVTTMYILSGDRESRMLAFLYDYLTKEEKRLKNWQSIIEKLPNSEKKHHIYAIRKRQDFIKTLRSNTLDKLREKFIIFSKNPIIEEKWPNIKGRFIETGHEILYTTVYGRTSSSIHTDAEATISYFLMKICENQDIEEQIGSEVFFFGQLMLYYAVKYFIEASLQFMKIYGMTEEIQRLELGLHEIEEEMNISLPHIGA